MMFINNYCTDFVSRGHGVCNMFPFNIVSHYFQFSFSFQDIYHESLLKFMSTGFNYEIYS